MKALTLTQPWASLVAIGAKTVETRSWNTAYRGPLAIHAAKGFPLEAKRFCYSDDVVEALWPHVFAFETLAQNAEVTRRIDALPRGVVLCIVNLTETLSTNNIRTVKKLSIDEHMFGNFDSDRWMWMLSNVYRLPKLMPANGKLGLWEWPDGDAVRT